MKGYFVILCALFFYCASCNMISAGTHGSIKVYQYDVKKDVLEKAVKTVIKNDSSIYQEEPSNGDFYNDGKNYFTIKILKVKVEYSYIVRYYGDEQDWNSSSKSEIFICYAYRNGIGGKNGDPMLNDALRKDLIAKFEENFINKLDVTLNKIHVDVVDDM